ncbi:MAG: thioredoxin family protein [bacterium]|nr:thioredoxin family protein [bacterium]
MKLRSLLATLAVALCTFGASAEGISFEHISLDAALEKAKAENKPIFIDVYATWCGPCKYLSREVFVEEELGAYMNEHFINLKLDGEEGDGDYLMAEFGLDAYPTMLFLSPDREELNRIVGAVSANEILEVSKGVIDPSSTLLFQLEEKYDEGNRDQAFMQSYINELVEKEKDFEPIVNEYLSLYPELDLANEDEFLIFCIGVNELDDPMNQTFLKNIAKHSELFPELTQAKMSILIYSICEQAAANGNNALIEQGVKELTGPLNEILQDTITEDDLRELMLETVSEV